MNGKEYKLSARKAFIEFSLGKKITNNKSCIIGDLVKRLTTDVDDAKNNAVQ
jgi:hypothetical protein